MSIWAVVFAGLSVTQGVGDSHPGQWLPFWRQACLDGRAYACPYLADLDATYCDRGSGWACNEAGLMHIALSRSGEDLRRLDPAGAAEPFRRGCELGFAAACAEPEHAQQRAQRHRQVRQRAADARGLIRSSCEEARARSANGSRRRCTRSRAGKAGRTHAGGHRIKVGAMRRKLLAVILAAVSAPTGVLAQGRGRTGAGPGDHPGPGATSTM